MLRFEERLWLTPPPMGGQEVAVHSIVKFKFEEAPVHLVVKFKSEEAAVHFVKVMFALDAWFPVARSTSGSPSRLALKIKTK